MANVTRIYPRLKVEMLEPVDAPIPTAVAKKLYREWMLRIGYLEDLREARDFVGSFAQDMKDHERQINDDLKEASDDLKDARKELSNLRKQLGKATDDRERDDLEEEIHGSLLNEADALQRFEKYELELSKFKNCKREFLVKYVNDQVHDIRRLLEQASR